MNRKQKRKIAIIVMLILLLAALATYYAYYRATKKLAFDISPVEVNTIEPPTYLFSFNGGEVERMQRPVGVLVDGQDVFVVDSARHKIDVFNLDGEFKRSFGASETIVPLYITKNPKDGNLYVSDRRDRSIHVFTRAGKYLRDFDPKLPKSELPSFDSAGVQWAPVAIAFHADGTMYVTEILNGHRLLVFSPDGKFKKSVGTVGIVIDAKKGPEVFQFPNGIAVNGDLVYVTDSNNRRVQVFDKDGNFRRITVTQGLPRGIAFLKKFPNDDAKTGARFVIVDTLAHDGTVWSAKGEGSKIVNFGEQGVLEGQFSYPNAVSVASRNNKIYITDTSNGRVQVWGWPDQASPVPIPRVPRNWWLCLLPLLLLPLLLLLRKKRFVATSDFVFAMVEAEQADLMPDRRRKWFVTAEDYERLKDITQDSVDMSSLLNESEYSESDARRLMERFEISEQEAIVLSIAQRAKVFCTEDMDLRRLAKVLEIDVVDRVQFIERFTDQDADKNASKE